MWYTRLYICFVGLFEFNYMWSIPLYGPLAIQSYGVALCCGLLVALWCALRHSWCREIIGPEAFLDMIGYAGIVGIIGARALHVVTEGHLYLSWFEVFEIWKGGFSILGTVIALLIFIPWYAYMKNIPLLLMLDLCGLYAPIMHSIARIGCWSAGCCGGIATSIPWAVYDEYGRWVHPTQWYSSLIFLVGFCVIRWLILPRYYRPGLMIAAYVLLVGVERWAVDWWRNDRIFVGGLPFFSVHQYVAVLMCIIGLIMWYCVSHNQRGSYEHLSSS